MDSPIRPYCFVRGKSEDNLKHAVDGGSMLKKEFSKPADVGLFKQFNKTFEADVPFARRLMIDMDMKISDVPICYVDIEVYAPNGKPRSDNPENYIMCIGMWFDTNKKILLHIDDFKLPDRSYAEQELAMIEQFVRLLSNTGIIVTFYGGETIHDHKAFDIPYIAQRWAMHTGEELYNFDYMLRHCRFFDLFQIYKFEHSRIGKSLKTGYGLDSIAKHELGAGKFVPKKSIHQLNKRELYEYCLDDGNGSGDVQLTKRIAEKTNFINLKINLAQLTNSTLVSWNYHHKARQDELRPLILIDQLVLKHARELGLVMPNRNYEKDFDVEGATVVEPMIGLHHGVQNFDIKQMYPNIILKEHISPDKGKKLVPYILQPLMDKREAYKKRYNVTNDINDYILQYNYKVLANVFYGAFANEGSRIANETLANKITAAGRKLLKEVMTIASNRGFTTIYGDTDSSFITIPKDKVEWLQDRVNKKIFPFELDTGEYYEAILLLPKRKEETGAKKRYIYLLADGSVESRGTEIIKSNYCKFARETILHIAKIVLTGKHYGDIQSSLAGIYQQLISGKHDMDLVINNGVKEISQYVVKKTKAGKDYKMQPHIRAYQAWLNSGGRPLFEISFYYANGDVIPFIDTTEIPTAIDYDTYWNKQILAPISPIIRSAYGIDDRKQPKIVKKLKTEVLKGNQALLFAD